MQETLGQMIIRTTEKVKGDLKIRLFLPQSTSYIMYTYDILCGQRRQTTEQRKIPLVHLTNTRLTPEDTKNKSEWGGGERPKMD